MARAKADVKTQAKRTRGGQWAPGHSGNPTGAGGEKGGRPRVEIASLADAAAEIVLRTDIRTLKAPAKSQAAQKRRREAMERVSRMCKGRVPTRVEVSGDPDAPPVRLEYIIVERPTE